MTTKRVRNSLAIAVGAALAGSLAGVSTASADASPFALTQLSSGYMTADIGEGKCGEGKCGGDKAEEGKGEEGKCGEGKCGGDKGEEGDEGKGEEGDEGKGEEGKCGEGKCGGSV